jgi:hypothetical protein
MLASRSATGRAVPRSATYAGLAVTHGRAVLRSAAYAGLLMTHGRR